MKKVTKDDYIQSIYKVIFYIEKNYKYDLTLEELSKVAGFSKYHFHRIFKSIIGENLSNYIRKVRLSSSTFKLKTNKKITQIALDSGYETNASFSRAFKNYFGMTPKEFSLNAKKKKGLKMLQPKIVELKPIEVLYVRRTGEYIEASKEAWDVLLKYVYQEINDCEKNLQDNDNISGYGIGHDNPNITKKDKLRYDACITWYDKNIKPQGEVSSKTIDGGKYAIFLHKGSYENMKLTYDDIGDWIVESGIEVRDLPMFEKYLNRDPRNTKPENLKTEIYVPLK